MTQTADLAWRVVSQALDVLADTGRPTPCQIDPDLFVSEDRTERAGAALACRGCPMVDLCLTYAELGIEPLHVWGGLQPSPESLAIMTQRVTAFDQSGRPCPWCERGYLHRLLRSQLP